MKSLLRPFFLVPVVMIGFGGCTFCIAQQPAAETLDQSIALPQAHQNALPGESNDSSLGDISPVQTFPKPATLSASVVQQVFYTNNVFYSQSNPVGSTAYLGSYTVDYVPYSTRDWTPQIGLQYNMVRFQREAAGDFNNETLSLSNNLVISDDRQWSWTAGINLSRYTTPHQHGFEFYSEVIYDNQIQYARPIIANTLYFVASYELNYHEAHPSYFDRVDNAVSFGLAYYPIPEIAITPFFRPAVWAFPTDTQTPSQHGRVDCNLSEGVEVTWKPVKYLSVVADFSETDDFSSSRGQSYGVSSPGLSVAGSISF